MNKEMIEDIIKGYKYAQSWSNSQDGSYGAALDDFYNSMERKYNLYYEEVNEVIEKWENGLII